MVYDRGPTIVVSTAHSITAKRREMSSGGDMEKVQELKREELDRVESKNGDKEKGADLEMSIKSYRDRKSNLKT